MILNSAWVMVLVFFSVLLAALAVLPGSLGVLKFTHKLAAHPVGAFFTYVVSVPAYGVSVGLMILSVYLSWKIKGPFLISFAALVVFAGISFFGFLMHSRFMFQPVRNPEYISMGEAIKRFGGDEEVIGVVDRRGRPYAYLARLARRPHIVHQVEGDSRFIMSHCILSHSSMAYEIGGAFTPERIFISSVLANNLVFYDKTGHCSVQQIYNQSIDHRRRLHCLPTLMTRLASWQRLYPESTVWVRRPEWRDTFYLKLLARASVIDPKSRDLVYPLKREPDQRLPLKGYVMGVEMGGQSKAYPIEIFQVNRIIEDEVGSEPVVFFSNEGGDLIELFSRRINKDRVLTFQTAFEGGFRDNQTSSAWRMDGLCVAGELKGSRLTAIPHYNKIFWCVWADFYPSTSIFEATKSVENS